MTRGMTARPRGVVQTRRVSQLCRLERVAGCGEKLAGGTGDVGIGSEAERLIASTCCPLFPQQRTLIGEAGTTALCQGTDSCAAKSSESA
jgi:hypothetical protein